MKILALDSSGLVASVAVVEDNQLLAEYTVNYKKTHSQTLLPMLDEIANMTELDLTGSGNHRCYCSGSRSGIVYRTSYRFRHGKGTGTGIKETADTGANSRRTGI